MAECIGTETKGGARCKIAGGAVGAISLDFDDESVATVYLLGDTAVPEHDKKTGTQNVQMSGVRQAS